MEKYVCIQGFFLLLKRKKKKKKKLESNMSHVENSTSLPCLQLVLKSILGDLIVSVQHCDEFYMQQSRNQEPMTPDKNPVVS